MYKKKILVTGAAGFIGFHTVNKFISEGYTVIGLDNINDYYSTQLKYERLKLTGILQNDIIWHIETKSVINKNYSFIRMNLEDRDELFNLFQKEQFDYVINLAAQAGVRHSIENPDLYIQSNIVGFHNILEACRKFSIEHLVHASSSSVYGENKKVPFSENDSADNPISLYAATKKSNELMAYSYTHLYKFPVTCLRFFTVYGPWGRPDMAPMLFVKAILEGKPINVFNNGEMARDFTYIKDIVTGIYLATLEYENHFSILNIGKGSPVNLISFIEVLEKKLEIESIKNYMPIQNGDVKMTWANIEAMVEKYNYHPNISIEEGVDEFVQWVKSHRELLKII